MPTIFEPKDLPVSDRNGVNIATLANHAMLGTDALHVERVVLNEGAKSLSFEAADAERFVYVVRGNGQAHAGGQLFRLDAESMLWLEKGEPFSLEAGTAGLEVLFCRAPAGK